MSIPTSSSVTVSAVLEAPLTNVWHLIKLQSFSNWWSQLSSSEYVKGTSDEADIVRWTFKDNTKLDIKQEEHSVSDSLHGTRLYHSPLAMSCLRGLFGGLVAGLRWISGSIYTALLRLVEEPSSNVSHPWRHVF